MPKYTITFNKQNYDIESQNPLSKAELDEAVDNIANQQRANESIGKKVQGFGREIGQIGSYGQAPHLAGMGEVAGGMVYDALHGKNVLKELYKDYKSGALGSRYRAGNEGFKEEQDKWETLHPKAKIAAGIIGTLATLPTASAVGKIPAVAKYLKGAGLLKRGTTTGAAWGLAQGTGEGLSNTEGKLFDPTNALIGGAIGTATGGAIGTALPLTFMGIKGIAKGAKALTKTGLKGNVQQYTVPEGVQTKTFRKLVTNPAVQKEAVRGDIGMRAEEFQNKATEKTLSFVPEIFDKVSKEYENLNKNTFLSFTKNNTLQKINKAVQDFGFDTKFMPNESAQKQVTDFAKNLLKATTNEKGELGITYENLQRAMKTAYEMEQKAYNAGDNAVGKLYSDIYNVLREARATNPEIEKTSQKYADISRVKEKLEKALGIKFEKGANHRQVATKLIQNARNRAGTQLDDTISEAADILKKYPDLEGAKELQNLIDLAQVAYDFRPPDESKLLNRIPTQRNLFNKIFGAATSTAPQTRAQQLTRNLQEGRITPQDITGEFDIVNGGRFTTGLNRFLQRQKVYGGKYNPIAAMMRYKKLPTIEHYQNPKGDFFLPKLANEDLALIGKKQKPLVLKQDIIEKNKNNHPELPVTEYNDVLDSAVYNPEMLIIDKPKTKPNYFVFVNRSRKGFSVIELADNKENYEIINFYRAGEKRLQEIMKRAGREGGQVLVTKRNFSQGAAGLPALPTGSNSIIAQKNNKVNRKFSDLIRNPLILATNSRTNDISKKHYDNNGGK